MPPGRNRKSGKIVKKRISEILEKAYYDPKSVGSFGGVKRLLESIKTSHPDISVEEIRKWLRGSESYINHRPARRRFHRRRIIVGEINQQWGMDLIDVQKLARHNDGKKYILTAVDVLSKYAYAIPIQNKTGKVVLKALKIMMRDKQPRFIHADQGVEFINSDVKRWLNTKGIRIFHTGNREIKSACVERFNRTLMERVYRYFTAARTLRYVDVLGDIVDSYNNSYHNAIKRAPVSVNSENLEDVWQNLYPLKTQHQPPRFSVGDRVKISILSDWFKKAYKGNWTLEFFTIKEVINTNPPTYKLLEDNGAQLKGSFYGYELQKVSNPETYRVEILKTKKQKGKTLHFVKWLGYPDSYNSWVQDSELKAKRFR